MTRFRLLATLLTLAAVVAAVTGAVTAAGAPRGTSPNAGSPPRVTRAATFPHATRATNIATVPLGTPTPGAKNIVFVLTDDLSLNLLPYMPHVQAMQRMGLTFSHYFVSDSLCCPSRSSIFTGNFPHDTGIYNNSGPDGGFQLFHDRGEEADTFAVSLRQAGYLTAMMGKYLNGYLGDHAAPGQSGTTVPGTYVPPGWSEWDVAGWGYPEYDYLLDHDHQVRYYGDKPSAYLTDVIARRGRDFIDSAAQAHRPFFLELATFAPHSPYTPAPRDVHDFPGLTAPRPPSFDTLPTDAPPWLAGYAALSHRDIAQINTAFRRRAQSVQAVDRMIGEIEATLRARGLARDTYIVFSSDNGLHTGEYRLMPGKLTAFDTDIHVPLIVMGPGVPAGRTTGAVAENIDLAQTFSAIAHTTTPGDGHSLLGLLTGHASPDWRNAALVEHHGPTIDPSDPDFQQPASGNPPSYEAMRTSSLLYVEYSDGERELYDLRNDPFELDNLAGQLTPAGMQRLHRALVAMEDCHGGAACWRAMHVPVPAVTPDMLSGATG